MAQQAQETFVAELADGPLLVHKGAVFADHHEVVRLDAGRGHLFRPLDLGEEPAKSEEPAESAPAAAPGAPAPVKAAARPGRKAP